jgi:hypothetical protein
MQVFSFLFHFFAPFFLGSIMQEFVKLVRDMLANTVIVYRGKEGSLKYFVN